MSISSSFASRFGDTPLAFGMERFEGGRGCGAEKRTKWFFSVQRYIGRDILIELEATPAMLREMERFLKQATEALATDGGRSLPTETVP